MSMKLRIFLSLLTFILATRVTAEPPQSITSLLPKFEVLVRKAMKEKRVPGLAVAIVKNGKIIYIKGFGVRTAGRPESINTHTVFQIGSASKAITSILVALLNRDKILSLDHPIETIPHSTVRHVMSHTTGIPSSGFNALIEKGMPAVDVYEKVQVTPPDSVPGEKFAYHNVVYSLIGNVIEQQSKMSFEEVLQTCLFKPLRMTETSSTWNGFSTRKNRVSVHCYPEGKGKVANNRARKVPYRQEYANFPAAGGCSSSIHDMALFLAAILGARPDVLSPNDLKAFIQPLIHTPDQWYRSAAHRDRITETHYGLGWRTMTFGGRHLVFHGGWIRGINAFISFIPEEKIGIVILQKAEKNLPFTLSMQFYDWVLDLPPKQWIN